MAEPADRPVLSAAAMLGDRVLPLPARAVVVFDESHVPKRRRRRDPAPFRRIALAGSDGDVAVVATVGPGGPTAAVTIEFLAHLGVSVVIAVGVAGDLHGVGNTDRRGAGPLPVSAAVAEDGTSVRYGSHQPGATLDADARLVAALVEATGEAPVVAVSTDTPLRHGKADITRFRQSARLVEMETAALLAAGDRCAVRVGALLVPSDGYHTTDDGPVWSAADQKLVKPSVTVAVHTAIAVLAAEPPVAPS
ncbi:MAG: hypothetical protein AAF531_00240 [Actinomycetota bacterium]